MQSLIRSVLNVKFNELDEILGDLFQGFGPNDDGVSVQVLLERCREQCEMAGKGINLLGKFKNRKFSNFDFKIDTKHT